MGGLAKKRSGVLEGGVEMHNMCAFVDWQVKDSQGESIFEMTNIS